MNVDLLQNAPWFGLSWLSDSFSEPFASQKREKLHTIAELDLGTDQREPWLE